MNESQMASSRGISASAKYPGCRQVNRLESTYTLLFFVLPHKRLKGWQRGGGEGAKGDAMDGCKGQEQEW